jgi:hypothetical protein
MTRLTEMNLDSSQHYPKLVQNSELVCLQEYTLPCTIILSMNDRFNASPRVFQP